MPRTITTEVYSFEELTDDAKERAHIDYVASGDSFPWGDEWQDSLSAFCDIAPVEWSRFDVTAYYIDCRAAFYEADAADLSGVRAWKWLHNNGWFDLAKRNAEGACTLTGYCGDCPLFDPIHRHAATPSKVPDLEQVFYECLQSWVYACRADQEHCESLDYFAELCEGNEWEFSEHGRMI